MNKKNLVTIIGVIVVVVLIVVLYPMFFGGGSDAAKWPEQDINVIVPWNPGGGTDMTTRTLVNEMSEDLGVSISVTNTPGASGSVGLKNSLSAKHDGYTIYANGMIPFVSYPVMGFTEKTHKDWHVWIATFSPNLIVTNPETGYDSISKLVEDMKNKPGEIAVGTAGIGSSGHIAIEMVKSALQIDYKHIPYEGGNPAIVATLGKEVVINPQLSMEMVDMIQSGELLGLATLSDETLTIGDKQIPSIADEIQGASGIVPMGEAFGIAVPSDVPDEVVAKIDKAFDVAMQSESMKRFAEEKGVLLLGLKGEEAQDFLDKLASNVCWTLYDSGSAKISPDQFSISKAK